MTPLFIVTSIITAIIALVMFFSHLSAKIDKQKSLEYAANIKNSKQYLLANSRAGALPTLKAKEHSYRAIAGENLLAIQEGADRLVMRTTSRRESIPIAKGIRYRHRWTEQTFQNAGSGRLLITDKAFVFEGDNKNERINWTQIADVELLLDGFKIYKRNGPPRFYQVTNPNPEFAAIIELTLARNS